MRLFFTSDTHFGHENIIGYCDRPFKNVGHMDETLIRNWNATVTPDDQVFHLGDFCIKGNYHKYRKRLNGNIIHIKGNHDKNSKILSATLTLGGLIWYACHIPEEGKGNRVICGHVHELWKTKTEGRRFFINVGVDQWDFRPIPLKTILDEYSKHEKGLSETFK